MKTKVTILVLSLLFSNCNKHTENKAIYKEITEFNKILSDNNLKGSILIFDYSEKIYYSNNYQRARTGFLPASTFKIPNTIIALETGIVLSDTSVFEWKGEKRYLEIWQQDLTLEQAFKVSCVPCYQEVAEKIGTKRMQKYLKQFDYGKMDVTEKNIKVFWLEGNSKITQFEQIEFLEKLYFNKLNISNKTNKIVKKIMIAEKTPEYTFSGKTGLTLRNGNNIGWYVGFLEEKNKVYFFAVNVISFGKNINEEFYRARIETAKQALKYLNLMN